MFEKAASLSGFVKRVMFLREPQFEERGLSHMPESFFGDFNTDRATDILSVVREHPEYHIISCIDENLYLNCYVENALSYFLGEGDSDQNFIFDPFNRVEAHFLQSLNSNCNNNCA